MFVESEHPRDNDGKFTEKGGGSSKQGLEKEVSEYKAPKGEGLAKEVSDWAERKNAVKQARREFAQQVDGWRPYGSFPEAGRYFISYAKTEELNNVLDTIYEQGGDYKLLQGLLYSTNGVFEKRGLKSTREISKMSYDELLAYRSLCQKAQAAAYKEREDERKAFLSEQATAEANKDKYINSMISSIGIKPKNFDKIKEAFKYRKQKEKELDRLRVQLNYSQNGYVDGKKSVKAVKAELSGKYPASECAKMLGTTTKKIQENLTPSEWHHSGGDMYNKINYYDISKLIEIQEDADLINDSNYKESAEIMKKLF